MKRVISFIITLALVLSLNFVATAEDEATIIYQTSFEDGWEGWEDYNKYTVDFVSLSKDCSTDGNASVFVNDRKEFFDELAEIKCLQFEAFIVENPKGEYGSYGDVIEKCIYEH